MTGHAMLAVNNNRSKAYLQALVDAGVAPKLLLVLDAGSKRLAEHTENDVALVRKQTAQRLFRRCPVTDLQFDEKEHVIATAERAGIPYEVLPTLDPNDAVVRAALARQPFEECLYSGPGSVLLRPPMFALGKRFVHAHSGRVPAYRGSTTAFYSALLEGTLTVSVIVMSPGLDEGDILLQREFTNVPGSDLDHVVDPCIRAATLVEYFTTRPHPPRPQQGSANTFFIIHPVLKHLALLKGTPVVERTTESPAEQLGAIEPA